MDELPRITSTLGPYFIYGETSQTIEEFFPELMEFYNGTYWNQDGRKSVAFLGTCWWEPFWLEPRIRALECVLRD